MKYVAPSSVEEATSLLSASPSAQVFAGATDVVPQLRAGRPAPELLVDLKKIEELVSLKSDDNKWTVGAATPTAYLTEDEAFSHEFPGLSEAAGLIGSDQIQNRSSLGGNLCNASPAADSVPAMVVNGVRAVVAGPSGTRVLDVSEVVTGPGQTSLDDDEFIVEFEIDNMPARSGDAYLRMIPRTEMDIAVVGAGARVTLADDGSIEQAALALAAVAPTVIRIPDAEDALVGTTADDATLDAVAAAASEACDPIDDKRGTVAYRKQVAGVLAKRAVLIAIERAEQRNGTN
ncbi:MAG: xanthine dehydrogenase family protein subunit M [Actinomycetota bacterium]|nr:oxidoreductase [Acidimicrobiaceae bacterium]MEC7916037.1 xanthine dehydrogenase family protein subunit M [Actinomycetota bacterium]MEC9059864.1 xanthine dehydrogenase family protein subunit M [Actinomycetota bacterium]